jgi:hypothetical protein
MPGTMNCPFCKKYLVNCSVKLTSMDEIVKEDIIDTYRCLKTGEAYRVNRKTREIVKVT